MIKQKYSPEVKAFKERSARATNKLVSDNTDALYEMFSKIPTKQKRIFQERIKDITPRGADKQVHKVREQIPYSGDSLKNIKNKQEFSLQYPTLEDQRDLVESILQEDNKKFSQADIATMNSLIIYLQHSHVASHLNVEIGRLSDKKREIGKNFYTPYKYKVTAEDLAILAPEKEFDLSAIK